MRMKKYSIYILVTVFMAVTVFCISCCNYDVTRDHEVTITFSWWGDEEVHERILEAISIYETLHPEINIVPEYYQEDSYFQKISTQMANGNIPDIFMFKYDWYHQTVPGAITKPANLKELNIDLAGIESWVKDCMVGGEVIFYPICTDGNLLIINVDFFERYGYSPQDLILWDDLIEFGKSVQERSRTEYLLQLSVDEINEVILPIYLIQLSAGGANSKETKAFCSSEQMTNALEFINGLFDDGVVPKLSAEAMATGRLEERRWKNGKIGMCIGTLSEYIRLSEYSDRILQAAMIPGISEGIYTGVDCRARTGIAISNNSKYKEEAADFLQWFVSSRQAYESLQLVLGIPANQNIREWMSDSGILKKEYLDIEKALKKENEFSGVENNFKDVLALRKKVIIEMLKEEIEPGDAAWEILMETKKIW